jgi:hypothetical protein
VPTQRRNIEGEIVQRAWSDPDYRARLLDGPKEAVAELLGVNLPDGLEIVVVEESPQRLCIVLPVDTSGVPPATARVMMGLPPLQAP